MDDNRMSSMFTQPLDVAMLLSRLFPLVTTHNILSGRGRFQTLPDGSNNVHFNWIGQGWIKIIYQETFSFLYYFKIINTMNFIVHDWGKFWIQPEKEMHKKQSPLAETNALCRRLWDVPRSGDNPCFGRHGLQLSPKMETSPEKEIVAQMGDTWSARRKFPRNSPLIWRHSPEMEIVSELVRAPLLMICKHGKTHCTMTMSMMNACSWHGWPTSRNYKAPRAL